MQRSCEVYMMATARNTHYSACDAPVHNPSLHNLDPSAPGRQRPRFEDSIRKLKWINIFGVFYFFTLTTALCAVGMYHAMPVVYKYSEEVLLSRKQLAVYMTVSVIVNFLLVQYYRSIYNAKKEVAVALPDSNWKYCETCDQNAPPRCHHCVICRKCVTKRDHHCYFTGVCIGRDNQRHFMALCFHTSLACSYAVYVLWNFLYLEYRQPVTLAWYHFVLPVAFMETLVGYLTTYFFLLILLTYLTICTGLGSGALFVIQLYLVATDLTSYEYSSGKGRKMISFRFRNWGQVLGPFGIVQFIIPLPCIPLGPSLKGDQYLRKVSTKIV